MQVGGECLGQRVAVWMRFEGLCRHVGQGMVRNLRRSLVGRAAFNDNCLSAWLHVLERTGL